MTRAEWHIWKKSVDPSYVIPSKEEDERMQWEELDEENRLNKEAKKNQEEAEAQRAREFTAFFNNPAQ